MLEKSYGDSDIANFIGIDFKDLFSTSRTNAIRVAWDPPFWHSCIRDKDVVNLIAPITNSKIVAGLWSLKAFKAPSPDGFHAKKILPALLVASWRFC